MAGGAVPPALARPADFRATYRILQSRTLALTFGRGFVLQDGVLIAETVINRTRPHCQALQATFAEVEGVVDVMFETSGAGYERALLRTVPQKIGTAITTIECLAEPGFTSALDISIALGRVVEIMK